MRYTLNKLQPSKVQAWVDFMFTWSQLDIATYSEWSDDEQNSYRDETVAELERFEFDNDSVLTPHWYEVAKFVE